MTTQVLEVPGKPIIKQAPAPAPDFTANDLQALVALQDKQRAYFAHHRKQLDNFLTIHLMAYDEEAVGLLLTQNADKFVELLDPWTTK